MKRRRDATTQTHAKVSEPAKTPQHKQPKVHAMPETPATTQRDHPQHHQQPNDPEAPNPKTRNPDPNPNPPASAAQPLGPCAPGCPSGGAGAPREPPCR